MVTSFIGQFADAVVVLALPASAVDQCM